MYKKLLATFSPNKKPLPNEAQHPVYINVYDLASINQVSTSMGFGIYHTGVEIFDIEYAYGGHSYEFSGIFDCEPRNARLFSWNIQFRERIHVGYTDFDANDIDQIVKEMGCRFTGDSYHLLNRNCNHFTDEFIHTLCGRRAPNWINRLANVSSKIPFLERVLPKAMIVPPPAEDMEDDLIEEGEEFTDITPANRFVNNDRLESNSTSSVTPEEPITSSSSSTNSLKSSVSSPSMSRGDIGRSSLKDRVKYTSPKLTRNRPFASLKR